MNSIMVQALFAFMCMHYCLARLISEESGKPDVILNRLLKSYPPMIFSQYFTSKKRKKSTFLKLISCAFLSFNRLCPSHFVR